MATQAESRLPQASASKALAAFTIPLAAVNTIQLLSHQVLFAGISRHPARPTETARDLAAFVVALSITWLATAPVQAAGTLFMSYGDGPAVRPRLRLFAASLTAASTLFMVLLAFTPFGLWAACDVQGLCFETGQRVQFALKFLIPWPLISMLLNLDNAVLKRRCRSGALALANVLGLICTSIGIAIGLHAGIDPLITAPTGYLVGQGMRVAMLGIVVIASRRDSPSRALMSSEDSQPSTVPPPWPSLARFYLPVVFNVILMLLTRPLVQWFLARGTQPVESVAAFGIALSTSQVLYNWLNEIASNPIAFRHRPDALKEMPRFTWKISGLVMLAMAIVFWTPLSDFILASLMGLQGAILTQSRIGLVIMVLTPALVANRAYHQGLATLYRQGHAWAFSAIARIGILVVAMLALSSAGMSGAAMGSLAVLISFLAEALVIVWCLEGHVPTVSIASVK